MVPARPRCPVPVLYTHRRLYLYPDGAAALLKKGRKRLRENNRCGVWLPDSPSHNYDFRLHWDGISHAETRRTRKYDFPNTVDEWDAEKPIERNKRVYRIFNYMVFGKKIHGKNHPGKNHPGKKSPKRNGKNHPVKINPKKNLALD